jgi:hypothetical protein
MKTPFKSRFNLDSIDCHPAFLFLLDNSLWRDEQVAIDQGGVDAD